MKTAIVCLGGGMRSAYSAGFLCAMRNKLSIPAPDIIIATSGSAGGAFYLISEQYAAIEYIWTKLLSTPLFVSPFRFWRILDIDYLVDIVFKKIEPLNMERFRQAHTRVIVSAVNVETGKPEFLDAQKDIDPMELLRATKANPIFYGKTVDINGKRYTDGTFGVTAQILVDHALKLGADRILCINDDSKGHPVASKILRLIAPVAPRIFRATLAHYPLAWPRPTVPQGKTLVYVKKKNLPATATTRDSAALTHIYNLGAEDAIVMERELRALFD